MDEESGERTGREGWEKKRSAILPSRCHKLDAVNINMQLQYTPAGRPFSPMLSPTQSKRVTEAMTGTDLCVLAPDDNA